MLTLTDINAYYDKSHVLHDVSVDVGDDEIIALLGRNGAGKTTTIKSVMGVVPRVEGTITFDDTSLRELAPDEVFNRGISWIPERRRIFTNLTVRENLKMGENNETTEADYEEVFTLFPRLEERLEQRAGTMSGGEQQMLAVGRALLSDPDLLLVDEPFEGLMPTLVDEVVDVLAELKAQDRAMLITEQNTEKTLPLADRVYIINSGQIVFEGGSEELAADDELQKRYLGVQA
jgi:branched-chain amino acid transport system ATP-binding protein